MTKIKFICIKPLKNWYFPSDINDIKPNQIIEIIFFPEYFQFLFNNKNKNLSNVTKETFFDSFIELNKWRELIINKILEN
jgi:hypothetical protein